MPTHAQASQIISDAWRRLWGRAPTDRERLYAQAIALLETGYGRAGQFGVLAARGQYNWGALETRAGADGTCPPGTASGSDQGSVCFYVFANDTDAAVAFLRTLTKKHWPVVEAMKGEPIDVARAMRVPPPYYTGTSGTDEQRAQTYASAITNAIRAIGAPVPTGRDDGSAASSTKTLAYAILAASAVAVGYHLYQTTPAVRRALKPVR